MIINFRKKEYKVSAFYIFVVTITLFKIILMATFSSDYQDKMFIPFVTKYVSNIGVKGFNVYDYYYKSNSIANFPYPPLMLFIESIPGIIIHYLEINNTALINFIYKTPILLFDFISMYFISKLFPDNRKYIGILYFASPIIIYAGFMHGQLDIIPTALLLMSIYYMTIRTKHSNIISAIALAAALLCKLHILAVLPLIYIFLYKKLQLKHTLRHIALTVGLTVLITIPYMGEGFFNTVLFNNEQALLTKVYFSYVNVKIYIPILVVLLIYLKAFSLNKINKDLLISFCGVLFAVFLALIPPMPGWYIWVVPFITIYFINVKANRYRNLLIYLVLNVLYMIYFVFLHNNGNVDLYILGKSLEHLKINNDYFRNIIFTLLSGTLLSTVFLMYQSGIESNALYKRRNLPFTIGIAGDSGSGKSTFVDVLTQCLGNQNLLFIEGDGDHKWERGEKMWDEYTHLNPKANYLYRQANDIQTLRKGASVMRVEYDHATGKFTNQRKTKPNKYIILCGLHSLYLPKMRKNLELKIFIDTDENLRRFWKIQRDTKSRGYSKDSIIEQIEFRMEDARKYIYPQKEYADLLIQYYDKNLTDYNVDYYDPVISLKLTMSADINLEPLEHELLKYHVHMTYYFSEDLLKQTVVFDGDELNRYKIPFSQLANNIIPQLDELTLQDLDDDNNINGLLKLILLAEISYKMQGEK